MSSTFIQAMSVSIVRPLTRSSKAVMVPARDGHWTCSLFRTLNKSWTKWTNEQWTPHFWRFEHMNMNTFFLSVFRTHEHEHANFYVVQLLFKLFWTKVEHWTLCSEHCSQVVHLFKIFSFLIRYTVIRYIIIRYTMWVINFIFTHFADWKGQNPVRERQKYKKRKNRK